MPQKQKYQKEIEDLLKQIDAFPLRPSLPRRVAASFAAGWGSVQRTAGAAWRALAPEQLILVSFVLVLCGYFFRGASSDLGRLLALAAAAAFLAGYFLSFVPRQPQYARRWRGRVVEFPRRPGWQAWLARRFRKRGR